MTDRPNDPTLRPIPAVAPADANVEEPDEDALPEHEKDADKELGAGVMSAGGTATETGLSERAGETVDEEDEAEPRLDDPNELPPTMPLAR